LHRGTAVSCGPGSVLLMQRRAKVVDFTFLLVEFLAVNEPLVLVVLDR